MNHHTKPIKNAIENLNTAVKEYIYLNQYTEKKPLLELHDSILHLNKTLVRGVFIFSLPLIAWGVIDSGKYKVLAQANVGDWLTLQDSGEHDKLNHCKTETLELWLLLFYVGFHQVNYNNITTVKKIRDVLVKRKRSYKQWIVKPLTLDMLLYIDEEIKLRE